MQLDGYRSFGSILLLLLSKGQGHKEVFALTLAVALVWCTQARGCSSLELSHRENTNAYPQYIYSVQGIISHPEEEKIDSSLLQYCDDHLIVPDVICV